MVSLNSFDSLASSTFFASLSTSMRPATAVILGFVFLLSACQHAVTAPSLPPGPRVVRGILRAAPLALDRRGTHVVSASGADVAYVESPVLHLGQYEGRDVTIHGIVQGNTDPAFLSVLVADDVIVHDPVERPFSSSALGIRFIIPETWAQSGSGRHVTFRLAGSANPLLSVSREDTDAQPVGIPIVVANKRAIRTDEGGGKQTVTVPLGETSLRFAWSPPGNASEAAEATAAFLRALNTVTITAAPTLTGSGTVTGASGSGSPMACGGPAGILCPAGSYCAVTDRVNDIGVCMPLRR